jgi:hypothetical protein
MVDEPHFQHLAGISWTPYGSEGLMPATWADLVLNRWEGFDPPLPQRRMSRTDLRIYCQAPETPVLHAFIAIMAWGGQLPRSRRYREDFERQQDDICMWMSQLRQGMPRADAYELWKGKVWGLGPSFITKLLAFTCSKGDMAIMDQWAVKAVNLLYGREVIRLSGTAPNVSPCGSTTGQDYDDYCRHLEDLRCRLGEKSLSDAEERIFSRRGEGTWRDYVEKNWTQPARKRGRSSPT